ncbi:MAG TPA: hypothetical protein VGE02_01975 [Gemmatimonadales bacterium]
MFSPLLEQLLDVVHAECVRSPAATTDAVHLRAVLFDRLLADGHGILEPSSEARVGRLLRLVDDVVRVERVPVPPRARSGGRPVRPADLRVWTPGRLDLELHARGTFRAPATSDTRALHHRLARLAAGVSDALVLACDRRSYDALRRGPGAALEDGDVRVPRPDLAALAAAVLPPSSTLAQSFGEGEVELGRSRRWAVRGAVTPMVFGVQRVVLALRPSSAGRAVAAVAATAPVQLDAFGE